MKKDLLYKKLSEIKKGENNEQTDAVLEFCGTAADYAYLSDKI